jgi:hypothetical protein
MKKNLMRRKLAIVFAIILLSPLVFLSANAAPPLPGAIFTTTMDGDLVNGNIFRDKCDVYLDGGPGPNAPQSAAGLPDGDYYFQVTDPSGQVLLSVDAVINRQFKVTGGVISGLSGAGNHNTGNDIDHSAITIQLCPFDDTPNPGGVYKVWVTPIGDFVGDTSLVDNGYSPGYFHGFIPAASKTDNFKVGRGGKVPCLKIIKFYDCDGDGVWDTKGKYKEEELCWPIRVYDQTGAQINGTLYTPVILCNLTPGVYTVIEEATDDPCYSCYVTANILDGLSAGNPQSTVTVEIGTDDRVLIFGNRCGCR